MEKEVMLGVPEDGNQVEMVEISEHRAMVCLPENAVSVEINAKVFEDGRLINVKKELTLQDLREAFRKADDGYIDDDDTFALTEKGRQYLDELNGGAQSFSV